MARLFREQPRKLGSLIQTLPWSFLTRGNFASHFFVPQFPHIQTGLVTTEPNTHFFVRVKALIYYP